MELLLIILMGAVIGFFLGFFGSGGSILALPALIYGLKIDPKSAIPMSLVIVGLSAIIGAFQQARQKAICYRVGLVFGSIAAVATFISAKLSIYVTGTQQLILFAVIMIISAFSMLTKKQTSEHSKNNACHLNPMITGGLGLSIGTMTGLVGVGGGFLIVPALSSWAGLTIRLAMGTSLFIIGLTAISGIFGYIGVADFHWSITLIFMTASASTTIIGVKIARQVSTENLKKGFAVFVMLIGFFLLLQNVGVLE